MSYLLAALISRASTFSATKRTQCLLKTLYSVDLVAMPEGPHPIAFRTRSLSLPGPMVLCLKSRESRSSPGLQNTGVLVVRTTALHYNQTLTTVRPFAWRSFLFISFGAGWSSPVARQAHNLKVVSSNLAPATKV